MKKFILLTMMIMLLGFSANSIAGCETPETITITVNSENTNTQQQDQQQSQFSESKSNANNSNTNEVIVVNADPEEITVNSHLDPMGLPGLNPVNYDGPFKEDHKFQKEILAFMLKEEGPKPFTVDQVFSHFSQRRLQNLVVLPPQEKSINHRKLSMFLGT